MIQLRDVKFTTSHLKLFGFLCRVEVMCEYHLNDAIIQQKCAKCARQMEACKFNQKIVYSEGNKKRRRVEEEKFITLEFSNSHSLLLCSDNNKTEQKTN